ncbi:pyridoxal-phosphate dependent enzyme [Flammeovirga yaeyamensis]|uniref:Pyridoxal-phosphate dependent enzyme n=1 Tax=Flammeovirga yaeyamensis TaxID=367791 RepID=A0AAX1N3E8_9BACT|nr:pyridoxal-phosphate dependent enzyme [Flammeovirga yaeyamensis]MBB3700630.1 cystathionine beta-synthase [Flammeovirga yaeyamensis]NMF37746.1 pyridoxal-phosphate dependent enzyme [Flammeovirga yaeyamensis]QWG02054.1 pyridoxal-phosphate dependent enzyme [Flammeovirga yaeyamensis]
MNKPQDLISLIGNTPLVKVENMDTGNCELYLKLENQNPGGSIKDRIALSMIENAEKEGKIKSGDTLIEATAGNTGLGLALISVLKGYKLILVMPDKMSKEKIAHLKAMGVQVLLTRSDVGKGHPEYYQDMAKALAEEKGYYYIDQFSNPHNSLAHELTTAPEIYAQMDQNVDAVVAGVGSSGTISGMAAYFKKVSPQTDLVLADPEGSILKDYIDKGEFGEAGSWYVEGIGEDFIPEIADFSQTKTAYTITDKESFSTARELLMKEGLLAGSSSGTLIAAALKYCQEQTEPKRVVTFVCDSGNKYFSKLFNDHWMKEKGFIEKEVYGDLRDLISNHYDKGEVVTASIEDTLLDAYKKMKMYDISQLPIMDGDEILGIIDESDILFTVYEDESAFDRFAAECMTSNLVVIQASDSIDRLMEIFRDGMVAILMNEDQFVGLITKIDVLNHLRQQTANDKGKG